jgi:hypothetical protein
LRDPISKIPNTKQTGEVAQVVKHLPSKSEALSSNSSAVKKKKKERNIKLNQVQRDINKQTNTHIYMKLYLPV